MYLRKYPNMTEENAFLKNDESNLQNMQQEYNIKSKADTKSTRNNFTNQYHTTSNAKENT